MKNSTHKSKVTISQLHEKKKKGGHFRQSRSPPSPKLTSISTQLRIQLIGLQTENPVVSNLHRPSPP